MEDSTTEPPAPKAKVLPKGELPSGFVGNFDVTEGVENSLMQDGTITGNWNGLADRTSTS